MPDFRSAKVGDRVWAYDGPMVDIGETNGEIVDIDTSNRSKCTIIVRLDGSEACFSYTLDGHYLNGDSMPWLYWQRPKIIGGDAPPKRKKKVKIEFWVNVYRHGLSLHSTKRDADCDKFRIACEHFEREIEVDE